MLDLRHLLGWNPVDRLGDRPHQINAAAERYHHT
jgi:hypothetical protein